jgi:hypothetical protein
MSSAGPPSDPAPDDAAGAEDAGVLGNLPRTRPAVRSPRRGQGAAAQPASQAKAAEEAVAEPAAGEPPAEPQQQEQARGPEAELEALARAGLSLAGGAATLGLRAAGRAAAALRDAVERR